MSSPIYHAHHKAQFNNPQEDMITYEELNADQQKNKRHALSMLSIRSDRTIAGLCYWTVDSATHWFLIQQKKLDLHFITPYMGSMDRIQYHHELRQLTDDTWTPPPLDILKPLFDQALRSMDPLTRLERLMVHLFVHMDDMGILKEWDDSQSHREHSMNALKHAPQGSWLLRRSSVKDSDVIKVRILCVKDKMTCNIEHIMLAHIYGFGYAHLMDVQRFQPMPFSHSSDPLPNIKYLAGSFVDLLYHFKHMMDMDKRLE